MLTPAQLQSIAKQRGDTVVNPTAGTSTVNPAADFAKRIGYTPESAQPKDLGSRLATDWQKRGAEASRIISDPTEGNALSRGVKATAQGFGGVMDVATESFKSLFGDGSDKTPEQIAKDEKMRKLSPGYVDPNAEQTPISKAMGQWAIDHPDAYNRLKNTLGTLSAGGEIAGTIAATDVVPSTSITKVSEIPGSIKSTANEFVGDTKKLDTKLGSFRGAKPADVLQKEFDTIQEKITPKPTANEAKLAQSQGRLIKGKEPTLFRSGTADEVLPTKDTARAVGTIQREIAGASKMDEVQLTDAIVSKTEEIAQNLKPEMTKVRIKPSTVQKINSDWEALKKTQLESADATEEANVLKLQKQFEAKLQKSGSGNMNDLWDTAKEYDKSVPNNVKKATSASDPKLQYKKDIWLQNRAILKNAINDNIDGLGATSKQAFSDMHDMYNAKENLLSKAKIETEAKPSKIKQTVDYIKKNPVKSALIGTGVDKVIKNTTGIGF